MLLSACVKKLINYISKCDLCYKIKLSRYKSYKKIRRILILEQLWASIVMHFIVKLLLLKKLLTAVINDLIITIVNNFERSTVLMILIDLRYRRSIVYIS